jgi:hypothetical protein
MKALIMVLAITLMTPRPESPALVHRLIVESSSTVTITGSTNISGYKCTIPMYTGSDTLVLHEGGRGVRPVFVRGEVKLDASSFDCGIAPMTSDFHKTINSRVYPTIVIDFISFSQMPSYTAAPEKFKGIVKISLAGVTKLFEVNCAIKLDSTDTIELTGSRDFLFSDFALTPPTRMLGAVKVKEGLKVSFHLKLALDPDS